MAHLEQKLKNLETRIRKLSVTADSADVDGLAGSSSKVASEHSLPPPVVRNDSALANSDEIDPWKTLRDCSEQRQFDKGIETLDYDCQRNTSNAGDETPIYRGRTTGLEVLRGLRCLCDFLVDPTMNPDPAAKKMIDSLNLSLPNKQPSVSSPPNLLFLSEASVHKWVQLAFGEAFVLWPFVDRHAFEAYAQHILEHGVSSQDDNNSDHLGLFHAVIALGQRHDPDLIGHRDLESDSPETRG